MVRSGTTGFFSDYFLLLDVRDENRKLKSEFGRIKLENQFLKTELSTADRARALAAFQTRSPSQDHRRSNYRQRDRCQLKSGVY